MSPARGRGRGDNGNSVANIGVPPCFRQDDAVATSCLAAFSRLLAGNEQAGSTTYRGWVGEGRGGGEGVTATDFYPSSFCF